MKMLKQHNNGDYAGLVLNLQFAASVLFTLFVTVHGNKQLTHVNKQCKIIWACLSHV